MFSPVNPAPQATRQAPLQRRATALACLVLAGAASNASANINIEFDYRFDTANWFTPQAKGLMDAAALVFESRITDNLAAITSGNGGTFNAEVFNPVAPFGPPVTFNNFSVAANEVRIFMGSSNLTGPLGVGGAGAFAASGGSAEFVANFRSRGQAGALLPTATDFGPWGGAIGFTTATAWYFDSDVSTTEAFSGFDFYSVAVHEIAHVLGVGGAPSWLARTATGSFMGPTVGTAALNGGKDHWAEGTSSFVGALAQEAAMDPSIANGQRKYFTTLDYAGLQDIGWQISPVPEPATWLMWGAGGALWAGLRRRAAR